MMILKAPALRPGGDRGCRELECCPNGEDGRAHRRADWDLGFRTTLTLTHQNLLFCRVPRSPILAFIIRTYQKVGFGGLR